MELLKGELMQLPRDSNALSLVHLLNEVHEEFVPREAVCQLWRKLHASSASQVVLPGNNSTSKLKAAKRARSAASIPIVRSRLLEVLLHLWCPVRFDTSEWEQ